MSTSEHEDVTAERTTPEVRPGTYSPVTVQVNETLGAIFLGIFGFVLLVAWMRAEARYRGSLAQAGVVKDSEPDAK